MKKDPEISVLVERWRRSMKKGRQGWKRRKRNKTTKEMLTRDGWK